MTSVPLPIAPTTTFLPLRSASVLMPEFASVTIWTVSLYRHAMPRRLYMARLFANSSVPVYA